MGRKGELGSRSGLLGLSLRAPLSQRREKPSDKMGKVPSKTIPCSPSTRLPAPVRVWFFSHHPSLSHRRLAMINKTNNYPVTTDCRPAADQQHGVGGGERPRL